MNVKKIGSFLLRLRFLDSGFVFQGISPVRPLCSVAHHSAAFLSQADVAVSVLFFCKLAHAALFG